MRLFIAVEIEEILKEEIYKLIEKLKNSNCNIKWVEKENLHLTLKFLGEIDESYLESIKSITKNIVTKNRSFSIAISGIGVFPNEKFPRVLWLGIKKGTEELKRIAELLDNEFSKSGFKKETREFTSHLTIGRFRSERNSDKLLSITKDLGESEIGEMELKHITIFQSKLTPQGPIYSVIERYSLC